MRCIYTYEKKDSVPRLYRINMLTPDICENILDARREHRSSKRKLPVCLTSTHASKRHRLTPIGRPSKTGEGRPIGFILGKMSAGIQPYRCHRVQCKCFPMRVKSAAAEIILVNGSLGYVHSSATVCIGPIGSSLYNGTPRKHHAIAAATRVRTDKKFWWKHV